MKMMALGCRRERHERRGLHGVFQRSLQSPPPQTHTLCVHLGLGALLVGADEVGTAHGRAVAGVIPWPRAPSVLRRAPEQPLLAYEHVRTITAGPAAAAAPGVAAPASAWRPRPHDRGLWPSKEAAAVARRHVS